MQTIDFYYDDGTRSTITFDGVYSTILPRIIEEAQSRVPRRFGDVPRLVVVTNTDAIDRPPDLYTRDGTWIAPLTPEFASIVSKLMALYYPYTRAENVQDGKEAAL